MSKTKYDPNGEYICVKGAVSIKHKNGRTIIAATETDVTGKPVTFKMPHRTPEEIQYLVEAVKVIKPAPAGGKK
ncbi:MAG: hypothetical protein CUN56_00185 [Phototrophicales bacterium]|nr:MAG: hypothetical protein CUN56_00185 [Phototrophicales bacterium]